MKLLLPILSFLAISILISCTSADIDELPQQNLDTSSPSTENSSSIVGKSSSSTSPSLDDVNCMVNGVCVELSQSACESFLGSQVPSCAASSSSNVVLLSSSNIVLSSSSSSLKTDNVICLIGTNCAEAPQITCEILGGTPVSSCPASSSSNALTPSSSSSAQQQQLQSSSSSRPSSSSILPSSSSSNNNGSATNCQYKPGWCNGKDLAEVIVSGTGGYYVFMQGTCVFVKDFSQIVGGNDIIVNGVLFNNAIQVKKESKADGGYYIYMGQNDGVLMSATSGTPDQCNYLPSSSSGSSSSVNNGKIEFENVYDVIGPLTGNVTFLCGLTQCGIECRSAGEYSRDPIDIGCVTNVISGYGEFSYITHLYKEQSINCNIPLDRSISCRAY